MVHYRIYELDSVDQILDGISVVCRSDAAAIVAACQLEERAAAVEVWARAPRSLDCRGSSGSQRLVHRTAIRRAGPRRGRCGPCRHGRCAGWRRRDHCAQLRPCGPNGSPPVLTPLAESLWPPPRRPGRGDQRWRRDRRRPAHRANPWGFPAAYVGIADHHQHQRADVGGDRTSRQLLAGGRRDHDLRTSGICQPAHPAGLPQRHDSLPAARDHPVLRLTDRQCGRNRGATCARQERRRLGLPDVLPALGSRHRARIAFHRSGPELQHAGRQSNGSATSHSADQLSQGGRYVTPTAAARATSSHHGSSAAPELRTDREQHLGARSPDPMSSWRSSSVPDHPAFG